LAFTKSPAPHPALPGGDYLYFNRDVKNKNSAELVKEIMALKNLSAEPLNKKKNLGVGERRRGFPRPSWQRRSKEGTDKQPVDHRIKITPYWLLGFVEAE